MGDVSDKSKLQGPSLKLENRAKKEEGGGYWLMQLITAVSLLSAVQVLPWSWTAFTASA